MSLDDDLAGKGQTMGPVIGDLLPLALAVAISPVPIIAVILMLLAANARGASLAFLLGWVVGISVVVCVATLLVQPTGSSDDEGTSTVASWITVVLGIAAVLLAVRQWRSRPRAGEEASLPPWMAAIDTVTPVRAMALGALLSGANPKNLTLGLAGGSTIGGAGLPASQTAVALAVFVVIASASVAAPVVGYLVAGDRVQGTLEDLRRWLTANNATVMSVLLLVIGVTILGKGIGGL
jgi:hypothetical protein